MATVHDTVLAMKTGRRTWQSIADEIGISKALAWRVAHGLSDSTVARHYFGLPPKVVNIAPCSVCGEVHRLRTCNKKYKKGLRRRFACDIPREFSGEQAKKFRTFMRETAIDVIEIIKDTK